MIWMAGKTFSVCLMEYTEPFSHVSVRAKHQESLVEFCGGPIIADELGVKKIKVTGGEPPWEVLIPKRMLPTIILKHTCGPIYPAIFDEIPDPMKPVYDHLDRIGLSDWKDHHDRVF